MCVWCVWCGGMLVRWCGGVHVLERAGVCWRVYWSASVCWCVLECAVECAVAWASLTAAAAGYIVGRLAGAQVVVVGVALAILRRLEAGRQGGHRVEWDAIRDDAIKTTRRAVNDTFTA